MSEAASAWRDLALTAISSVESAVRETNWGQPTFGPDEGEEYRETAASIDARFPAHAWLEDGEPLPAHYREVLASGFIRNSGKELHASNCATSIAPAMMPGPCDCDFASLANQEKING